MYLSPFLGLCVCCGVLNEEDAVFLPVRDPREDADQLVTSLSAQVDETRDSLLLYSRNSQTLRMYVGWQVQSRHKRTTDPRRLTRSYGTTTLGQLLEPLRKVTYVLRRMLRF